MLLAKRIKGIGVQELTVIVTQTTFKIFLSCNIKRKKLWIVTLLLESSKLQLNNSHWFTWDRWNNYRFLSSFLEHFGTFEKIFMKEKIVLKMVIFQIAVYEQYYPCYLKKGI